MCRKILVVDDEEIVRRTLKLNLLDEGYEVDMAASGEEALTLLDNRYDLVITDLVMEGMDGLEVLKHVKDMDRDTIVFILTGYGELDSAVAALRAGAEDYLLKPYNSSELMLRLARVFETRELKKTVDLYEDILSICSECKKIRDDMGEEGKSEWVTIEQYLGRMTGSSLSHGLCPECFRIHMDALDRLSRSGNTDDFSTGEKE